LEKADKMSLTKGNARKYLQEFQNVLLNLQSEKFLSKLRGTLEINPPSNCKIETITPSMRSYKLQYSDWSITIPDLFIIKILANIEDRETAIHANVTMDLKKYKELLKEEFSYLTMHAKRFKF